ncbi:MAG: phage tail protein I [Armatimonadota bacterium]|nr:phage tail protein I [bacterium]
MPNMELANLESRRLLPQNLSTDEVLSAILNATDTYWQELAVAIPTLAILATIDQQPENVIDDLAWQFHVDYWNAGWDLATKRTAVKNSFRLHKLAGTRGAVNDLIRIIWGDGAIVSEWWQHGGEPGTFDVTLTNGISQAAVNEFVASIRMVKRATDHINVSIPTIVPDSGLHIAPVVHIITPMRFIVPEE